MTKQLTTPWLRGSVPVMTTMMALMNRRIVRIEPLDLFPDLTQAYDAPEAKRPRVQEVRGFSGKSDSYEQPLDPDIHLTTMHHSPEEDAQRILRHLIDRGFLQDT